MNTFKRSFLLMSFLTISTFSIGQNLIYNAGFEEHNGGNPGHFEGWNISSAYGFDKSATAHSGNNSLKAYPQGIQIKTFRNGKFNYIPVQGGATYTFSFWYKGQSGSESCIPIIQWYDNTQTTSLRTENISTQRASTGWKEYKIDVTAPSTASWITLGVNIRFNGSAIFFDDFSLTLKQQASNNLQIPQGFSARAFQREIALHWEAERDPQIQWDIVINDGTPIRITQNSHILTQLSLNTNYRIKLRSVKGAQTSNYTDELSVTTLSMSLPVSSSERIPHLRNLPPYGRIPRTIDLFYNDLAEPNAEITYWIDGVQTSPNGHQLSFPKAGNQKLKIRIKEATDRIWTLQYPLNVE